MALSEQAFVEKLKTAQTDYIQALLSMATGWSAQWVIDALHAELSLRQEDRDGLHNTVVNAE